MNLDCNFVNKIANIIKLTKIVKSFTLVFIDIFMICLVYKVIKYKWLFLYKVEVSKDKVKFKKRV